MPEESIWQFMELFNDTLGQHCFCVCHLGRPESNYKFDFNTNAFMDYVPVPRSKEVVPKAGAEPGRIAIKRAPYPNYTLNVAASSLYRQIDGKKSIRECFSSSGLPTVDAEAVCRATFRQLWRLSYIFLRLPS